MTTTSLTPSSDSLGSVYKNKDGTSWYAEWIDHAGRRIVKKLGDATKLRGLKRARQKAFEVVEAYRSNVFERLEQYARCTDFELEEMALSAAFPREVVARFIREICERLAREHAIEIEDGRTPAVNVFVARVNDEISGREVNRILEDIERITVSQTIVDRICTEFNINYYEMAQSARRWAERTDEWSDRFGTNDPWPIGYTSSVDTTGDELL
jgi:hypothetical protein